MKASLEAGSLDPVSELEFVPFNDKIADISEDDTDRHFLDLETTLGETRKIVSIIVGGRRIIGTGWIYYYPNEGEFWVRTSYQHYERTREVYIKEGTNRLQYRLDTVGDDWDLYCFGYTVEA